MKQIFSLFLTLALTLALAACGSPAGQTGSDSTPDGGGSASAASETLPENQPEDLPPSGSETPGDTEGAEQKILIAYFSATNNTKGVASRLADILGADLYEIVPETPYTSDDLNYNTDCRANREQNDPSARPAISGSVEDMEQYGVIFLGYPIWWGQAPKIISTFLESYDLEGRTVVPFCTSGSSGIGSSAAELQDLTDGAIWLEGRRFSGGASESDVQSWADSLNLN